MATKQMQIDLVSGYMHQNQKMLPNSYSIYENIPSSIIKLSFNFYYEGSGEIKCTFKCVLLGTNSVGKTSIFQRFTTNTCSEYPAPTIGASWKDKTIIIDTYSINFQMWDTAGQERYRSLAPMYYRGAAIAIVVFDITDHNTYTNAKHWINEVRHQEGDHVIIGCVANKCDLMDNCQVNMDEIKEFISNENNVLFFETSAKTGKGVMNVFEKTGLVTAQKNVRPDPAPRPFDEEMFLLQDDATHTNVKGCAC